MTGDKNMESPLTIAQAQKAVDAWICSTGAGYFGVLTNMAMLAEETGEVARCISRIYGDQVAKTTDRLDLGDELADVIWVVMALANQCGVDLEKCFASNLKKKLDRDSARFAAGKRQDPAEEASS